ANEYLCSENELYGGVCYPGSPKECSCNEADIFRTDLYNPSKFLECGIVGSEPKIHSCQEGFVFDEENSICVTEIYEWTCTAEGTSVVEDDCTKYFTCIFTTEGYVHKEFTCPNNTMFNDKTGKCEDPCYWYYDDITCEVEGRFADPSDCTQYHECIADPLIPSEFIRVKLSCPEGLEWSQIINEGYGHCVARETTEEQCVPQKPKENSCKIPNEWCTTEPTTEEPTTEEPTIEEQTTEPSTEGTPRSNMRMKEQQTKTGVPRSNTGRNPDNCVTPWVYGETSSACFLFVQKSMDWDSARTYCLDNGGELLILDLESKRSDIINSYETSEMINHNIWLGANDRSGSWYWINGSPVSSGWKYWSFNEDNMCMFTNIYGHHEPLVNFCSHSLPNFICEK
ncbi:unnamed protein product, partial [Meganyctiphanes norvegica]